MSPLTTRAWAPACTLCRILCEILLLLGEGHCDRLEWHPVHICHMETESCLVHSASARARRKELDRLRDHWPCLLNVPFLKHYLLPILHTHRLAARDGVAAIVCTTRAKAPPRATDRQSTPSRGIKAWLHVSALREAVEP